MKKRLSYGFTLIELLVVIAIIALLSSIILASLNTANAKGRDAKRVSDISQIRLALTVYFDANNSYPSSIYGTALTSGGYISTMPTDPSGNTQYSYAAYQSNGVCNTYHLGASLETQNTALQSDADKAAGTLGTTLCSGSAADFSGSRGTSVQKCNAADAGLYCFDVTP